MALFCVAVFAAVVVGAGEASDPHAVVRGMIISCHRSGQVWATDATAESMDELKRLGVNWVAIHPYAGIRADGTVVMRSSRYEQDVKWLTRPIAEAHQRGLKIAIKPHIAHWGSPFSWRGDITFQTEAQWRRFFETYEAWVTRVAELCADADAIIVGTELDGSIHRDEDWRRIIAAVRQRTDAPLTYSANWDQYGNVGFWDALDAIAIQGYFPLVDHDRTPTAAELETAWRSLIRRLEAFAAEHDRKIVLGELGYNRSAAAALRPWDSATGGPEAEEVQRRCLTAALRALKGSDVVTGAFLWKWFPVSGHHETFLMTTPAMRQVIHEQWGDLEKPRPQDQP